MTIITCACGQSFPDVDLNGNQRTLCPVCRRRMGVPAELRRRILLGIGAVTGLFLSALLAWLLRGWSSLKDLHLLEFTAAGTFLLLAWRFRFKLKSYAIASYFVLL